MHPVQTICDITGGKFLVKGANHTVKYLLHDSRRVIEGDTSLFFALITNHGDGHRFIADALTKGVRNFIVSKPVDFTGIGDGNVILVADTLKAMQTIAAYHRRQFAYPVIGITGSNGKTIVKEWLYQLLKESYRIVRSPKSYNSQVGVPLSVWQMNHYHDLALFEAGISEPGEMDALQEIIAPEIGILTNIGEAHDAHFTSHQQKLEEKLKLFQKSKVLIGQHAIIRSIHTPAEKFTWGNEEEATVRLMQVTKETDASILTIQYHSGSFELSIPFTDDASVQNTMTCLCALLYLNVPHVKFLQLFKGLHPVDMRLQLKHGINNCLLINDSYSADTTSLKIALEFLQQQSSGLRRTVILSDFAESGKEAPDLYREIAGLLRSAKVDRLILVGPESSQHLPGWFGERTNVTTYPSTNDLITQFKSSGFFNEIILLKGARVFEFERVAALFERKVHQTVLEINLNALAHNLKEYQKLLQPETGLMAMVKAFSYGSGGAEIASVLQYHNVQYLGVAYADEGVDLVKAGIRIPIMVMNAEETSFQAILEYNLQPVIYSFEQLYHFNDYLNAQGIKQHPVHIEVETGMNRLGFKAGEILKLGNYLNQSGAFSVQTVFSHLAASEDPAQDAFTIEQASIFQKATIELEQITGHSFLKHLSNSAAILRHPQLRMDLVRLGIGLYGIETVKDRNIDLQAVATLRSTIAQIKRIGKGESVSYNRRWIAQRESTIATIRIGYADGYSRQFSNGVGQMLAGGRLAPVIGSVCMDMTMIDISGIEGLKEGDDVVVFGEGLPVQQLADWISTIPYEILTSVSQRVKRVYFHE
jgi:alanine racemase